MKAWTKEEALQTLQELADEAGRLRASRAFSTQHTMWVTKCLETLEEIFCAPSRYYRSFATLTWRRSGSFVYEPWKYGNDHEAAKDAVHHEAFLKDLETAKGLLLGAEEYLSKRQISDVCSPSDTGPEVSLVLKVLRIAEHQLRKVIRTPPNEERQVQDAFENLLIGADIPYGREIEKIEYSSKTYTPDFSLPKIGLVAEVKLCGQNRREKEIIAEINDDILSYQTKYQNLLFVVYDLGFIRDVEKFCDSFEKHENVTVRVVKH